jgi:hypothetical protein
MLNIFISLLRDVATLEQKVMKSPMLSTKSPLIFVSGNVLYVGKITLEFKKITHQKKT